MTDTTSPNRLIKELSSKIDKFQLNVNSKFEKIDSRFTKMDSRFTRVETSLDFIRMDVKNVEKQSEEIDKRNERRYSKVMDHIDGLAKGFKKFDEEQTILSNHSIKHTDKIERLEKKVFGTVQI